jgi:hypothetical protein
VPPGGIKSIHPSISTDNGGFLIDLDLAVKEQRISASGAKGKTGTRAFMAIGTLLGEQHSFMHDLESFFWVLFCWNPKTENQLPLREP